MRKSDEKMQSSGASHQYIVEDSRGTRSLGIPEEKRLGHKQIQEPPDQFDMGSDRPLTDHRKKHPCARSRSVLLVRPFSALLQTPPPPPPASQLNAWNCCIGVRNAKAAATAGIEFFRIGKHTKGCALFGLIASGKSISSNTFWMPLGTTLLLPAISVTGAHTKGMSGEDGRMTAGTVPRSPLLISLAADSKAVCAAASAGEMKLVQRISESLLLVSEIRWTHQLETR